MGMKKNSTNTAPVAEGPMTGVSAAASTTVDSGTAAAVIRLKKKTDAPASTPAYSGRDFEKEARGKTRCVQFEAALMSPALAGAKWDTVEDYLALCRKAADAGVAYTFGE